MYSSFQSLPNSKWLQEQELRFEVPVTNISTTYKLKLELRSSDEYPFRNLTMLIDCQIPDGGVWRSDTLNVELADRQGKWYGNGISVYSYAIPYCSHIQYPDTGMFVYTVRHGMEENVLQGISDVGLTVEYE
ncbi:gliding motility lipoprotein GldH [Bacteroidia bacterium]|nr:gliding motility lipoprotein GldH [Bacteroidia bacterium]